MKKIIDIARGIRKTREKNKEEETTYQFLDDLIWYFVKIYLHGLQIKLYKKCLAHYGHALVTLTIQSKCLQWNSHNFDTNLSNDNLIFTPPSLLFHMQLMLFL